MHADIRLLTKYAINTTQFQNIKIITAYKLIVKQKTKKTGQEIDEPARRKYLTPAAEGGATSPYRCR